MTISSRTPDGHPARCTVCGAQTLIDPSEPHGDAPCPACGALIWPLPGGGGTWLLPAGTVDAEKRAKLAELIAALAVDNADSLDRVECLMQIEDLLDLEIPDEAAETMQSVDEMIAWILRRFEPRDGDELP
ncbi:acyl carrier protein [Phycisphaerae bacterium RAS1]|nr:acyl carrier protein [Phycisphaerae bacterium RAS1]